MKDVRKRSGCAVGTVALSSLTCLAMCFSVPNLLWAPFGIFYSSLHHGQRIAGALNDELVGGLYLIAGPPIVLCLAWMIYGICYWRTPFEVPQPPPEPKTEESPTGITRS